MVVPLENRHRSFAIHSPALRATPQSQNHVFLSGNTQRITALKATLHREFNGWSLRIMTITKKASAHWSGGIKDGKGTISTQSGALSAQPYGFNTRFEDKPGTNPEELLGAAHAGCFTMALSLILGNADLTATALDTEATVSLDQVKDGFAISKVHLKLRATIPGATEEQFLELANAAKAGCPLSKVINTEITLDAALNS